MVVSLIVDSGIALCICLAVLRKECVAGKVPLKMPWRDIRNELPVLWRFALPGVIAGLATTGMMWVGRVILIRGADGYVQLGLFTAANQWRTPMLFLPAVLCRVILPLVSETYSASKMAELRATIEMNLKIICLTALPILSGGHVSGRLVTGSVRA